MTPVWRFAALALLALPALARGADLPMVPEPMDAARYAELVEMEEGRKARQRLHPINPRVSRYMAAAAEAADAANAAQARDLIGRLNVNRMNPHEKALVYRLRGFIAYSAGDADEAIEAFRNVLAQEMLVPREEARVRFNIAQLYAGQQKWPEAITALHDWFRYTEHVDPLAYYLLAIAHFQRDELDAAIANVKRAVDLTDEPKESWLQLLAALYIQSENYAEAAPVLEELVLRFPKKLYWVQLSLIYGALENYRHSLAVQQVAYLNGLLEEDKELRRLARGYLFADLPYPAAKVLEKGLEDGSIEGDAESWELLANSWIAAREYDRSVEPLRRAAELAEDGNLYVRLGQVYLQREEWSEAVPMFEKAIDKGGLDELGEVLLLLGIATYNLGDVDPARGYFVRAREREATRQQAENWLKHLDVDQGEAEAAEAAQDAARAPRRLHVDGSPPA
jgi:tetratricopeptide (TPR) repeat protein